MTVFSLREQPDGFEKTWLETGRTLRQHRDRRNYEGSQLMRAGGDWLLEGEDSLFRHKTRAHVRHVAVELTGYSKHTLAMAASVSRKIRPSMRIEGPTWWRHLVVTKLPQEARVEWLARAAEEDWTAAGVRRELKVHGEGALDSCRRPVAERLVGSLINLSRNEVTCPMRAQLRQWWRREFGQEPPDMEPDEQGQLGAGDLS